MKLNRQEVNFQLNSGATVNILPAETYKRVSKDPDLKRVRRDNTTLVMFNKSQLSAVGKVSADTVNPTPDTMSRSPFGNGTGWLTGERDKTQLHRWVPSSHSDFYCFCSSIT